MSIDAPLVAALSDVPLTAVSQDRDLRITWIHDPRVGSAAARMLGQDDHALFASRSAAQLLELKRHVLETGAAMRRTLPLHTERGGRRAGVYDVTIHPQRDADGDTVGVFTVWIDVTERLRQHEQAARSERHAAIGAAAAVLAHELANSLNGIHIRAQLLERRAVVAGDEPVLEGVRAVRRELERVNSTLHDLQGLARRTTLAPEPTDPVRLVHDALDELEAAGAATGIEIRRELPARTEPVVLEAEGIRRMLVNLCRNAVEAMPDGGTLTVRMRTEAPGLTFEIRDTGDGIPEEVDPFAAFVTTKPEGKGLGLPICRRLVRAHGGTIDYVSEAGVGTTFTVALPIP